MVANLHIQIRHINIYKILELQISVIQLWFEQCSKNSFQEVAWDCHLLVCFGSLSIETDGGKCSGLG